MTPDRRTEILGALLLAGVALTHALVARDEDARYIVVLFALLAAATLLLATLLVLGRASGFARPAAGSVCAIAIAGYLLSRTVGLPQMDDDVSNWGAPLGIAALVCETGVIAVAVRSAVRGTRPGATSVAR
jgi:hypothetical protein